jgi:nickel-type superoxide dismutase maturation protease
MQPTLRSGALVVAERLKASTRLRAGDVVVARHPERPGLEIIKRVHSIDAEGSVFLLGDNAAPSTDSRNFGPITRDQIVALVRWRYWPLPPRRL